MIFVDTSFWVAFRNRADSRNAEAQQLLTDHADAGLVTSKQEDEAWHWLRRHDEREYSFVDATSFVVMKGLRLRQVLAFDGDFSAAGFIEVRL